MPQTVVAQYTESGHQLINQETRTLSFSYHLTEVLKFSEPHYARLIFVGGAGNPTFVFADFVQPQQVNGQLESYLGCSSAGSVSSWVPIATDSIPAFGYIHLRRADNRNITTKDPIFSVVIEIASESWINGTKGQT